MKTDFFELLQLNDATFPIGSYAFSWGLETFVQQGIIFDSESAEKYIKDELEQSFLFNELLAARFSYENFDDEKKIAEIDEIFGAGKSAFEIREGSKKIAARFEKTTSAFSSYESCAQTKKIAGSSPKKTQFAPKYFPVAYGFYCAAKQIPEDETLSAFLYSQMSARVTTAVKLVPLSQTEGQKILFTLLHKFPETLEKCKTLGEDDLCKNAPGIDIRAMQHEFLYSRLYSN